MNVLWLLKTSNSTLLPYYAPEEWSMAQAFRFGCLRWQYHLNEINEIAVTTLQVPSYEITKP